MSTDPLAFRKQVRQAATPEESLRLTLHGIAEEIEARIASPAALRELAESLRESADEIFDDVFETPESAPFHAASGVELNDDGSVRLGESGMTIPIDNPAKKKKAREKAIV